MRRTNQAQNPETKIQLTSKEKSELFLEGILTVILLILLNISIIIIGNELINSNPTLNNIIYQIKIVLSYNFENNAFLSWKNFLITFLVIFDAIVVYWRLKRRYKQMLLQHIINELHYIAQGNYEYRLNFELGGDLGRIIESINLLVSSTIKAIEEERKIEKSKDELITNVSHDIRTPLTSIIGYLGLIENRQYHNEDELLKYTNIAYMKAKQMKVMVDDLFEYTKVRQPGTPLTRATFDMTQLMEQLVIDFDLEAQRKNKVIELNANHPFIMTGDADKLVRVFSNLISNALKYGKNGRTIIINIEKIGKEAVITIKNDGQTIPKESLDKLFDRFYRVEASRNQETGGTGLGLAIAQSIVVLHGGYIFAKSENNWTSFIIHLPLIEIQ